MNSFCDAKNQAECHYRRRRAPHRPSDKSISHQASTTAAHHLNPGYAGVGGRSFWRTGADAAASAAALAEKREISDEATSEAGDELEPGLLLPLKRLEPKLEHAWMASTL